MSNTLPLIILFTALGGVLSAVGAGLLLVLPRAVQDRMLPALVTFAIGALLGAAFLALLPHAVEQGGAGNVHKISFAVLGGLLVFFLLEKLVLWRHCHHEHCEAHSPEEAHESHNIAAGKLILVGDTIHNLVDGILIAAAFLTDVHLGIVTSLAVIAHEIPQEVGDFALLLHGGFTRSRAFVYNVLSGMGSVIGGVLAYFFLKELEQLVPYVLAVAASSFIYIAVADLIPGLHKRLELSATAQQVVLIIAGISTIYTLHMTLH